MATISLTLPVAGTVVTAGLHSTNYTTLQNFANGGIDQNNFASGKIFDLTKIMQGGAATGQFLKWDGTNWVPATSAGVDHVPVDLRNPQQASNAGNCFPTVTNLTAWEEWHWEFVKDVDGKLFGVCRMPATAPTAAKLVLTTLYNATSGVARWSVSWASAADAASLNPASVTAITSQDITVPGTARLRKDVTFTLASQPAASDIVIVQVFHEGAHANDTVAVNSELLGAYFLMS